MRRRSNRLSPLFLSSILVVSLKYATYLLPLHHISKKNIRQMSKIEERLDGLRYEMRSENIDAVIIPTSDPHNSEYVAPHWQVRQWITGFTGSAGTAVITLDEAALWTDSRYFLQAEKELEGRGVLLMKEGIEGTPTITEWLLRKLSVSNGKVVALDSSVMNYAEVEQMGKELRKIGVTLRTNYDAAQRLWKERPSIPSNSIYTVEQEWIGESTMNKLTRIREVMRQRHCDAHIVTDLMSIAWTLNLRGSDVSMTPVFLGYLLITLDDATLFVNGTLTAEASAMLSVVGVNVRKYDELSSAIAKLDGRILIDPLTTNYAIYNKVKEHAVDGESPIIMFKAVKNEREIEGFRQAMEYDGVAMVRFLRWLKPAVEQGGQTEISVSDKLEQLRRENKHCLDLSFNTICGYNAHGAIVHYTATPESNAPLRPEGLLLIDSGAQYDCGTTDITRTIALGPISEEMKRAYTYVLKAHIALATATFPEGTNGTQIDAIARSQVWRGGYNYMHGTGHGVGWRLSVHEGPQRIHMNWFPAPLRAGMTITDEPGIYLEGKFGIRTENVMVVEPVHSSQCTVHSSNILCLTPLTLCPIDTTPIDFSLLTEQEKEWLNAYHERVREKIMPLLTDDADKQWFIEATKKIV